MKTLTELKELFKDSKTKREAVIVFTKDSFKKPFSEKERSYKVSSQNRYFETGKISNSLIGDCLDGTDQGVRLDYYLGDWKIEKIYLLD